MGRQMMAGEEEGLWGEVWLRASGTAIHPRMDEMHADEEDPDLGECCLRAVEARGGGGGGFTAAGLPAESGSRAARSPRRLRRTLKNRYGRHGGKPKKPRAGRILISCYKLE
jgi:hypothetical protein